MFMEQELWPVGIPQWFWVKGELVNLLCKVELLEQVATSHGWFTIVSENDRHASIHHS
jgi:hypothetical protein